MFRDGHPRVTLNLPGSDDPKWNDDERPVGVLAIEGQPLLGTQLLTGHLLGIELVEGGEVLAGSL